MAAIMRSVAAASASSVRISIMGARLPVYPGLLDLADLLHDIGELVRVPVPEGAELRLAEVLDRRLALPERALEGRIGDPRAAPPPQARDHRPERSPRR